MKLPWLFLVLSCVPGFSQERIELRFDPGEGRVEASRLKVRHGHVHTLDLTGINSAHTALSWELGSYEFVSPIPEMLVPLIPGFVDDAVFGFPESEKGERERPYRQALRSFNALERLRVQGDSLFRATQYSPDTALAKAMGDRLLEELQLGSFDRLALEIERTRYYMEALLQAYGVQVESLGPGDPQAQALLLEYADLKRMRDRLATGDHAKALDFMLRSRTATSHLSLGGFRAEKDVVDLQLQVLDTYTGETPYRGTVSFVTYGHFSFDFSTGLFLSDVVERRYYRVPGAGDTDRILREDTDPIDISMGALAHLLYKVSPTFGAGLALGASLSPLDGHLRYLMGPSFMLGGQKLFSLGFGLSLARMDRLSPGVARDTEGPYLPKGEPIRTLKKMEAGFFAGISYNLSRKRL